MPEVTSRVNDLCHMNRRPPPEMLSRVFQTGGSQMTWVERIRVLHIAAGFTALAVFWLPIAARKAACRLDPENHQPGLADPAVGIERGDFALSAPPRGSPLYRVRGHRLSFKRKSIVLLVAPPAIADALVVRAHERNGRVVDRDADRLRGRQRTQAWHCKLLDPTVGRARRGRGYRPQLLDSLLQAEVCDAKARESSGGMSFNRLAGYGAPI